MTVRVRAPELRGRGWLNTGGRELTLTDLRGKIVLLDFWTFCCINCLHVLDELRPLEEKYGDVLVDHRRPLAEVRARARPRRRSRPPSSGTASPTRCSTTPRCGCGTSTRRRPGRR